MICNNVICLHMHYCAYIFLQIVTVSDDDGDRFKAAQVNIGMFGILSKVTLRVEEKYFLREIRTHHSLTYCLENMHKLVKEDGYSYVKMWVEFYNDFCVLYQTNKTSVEKEETPGCLQSFLTVSQHINSMILKHG